MKNPFVFILAANTVFLSLLVWICVLIFFGTNVSVVAIVIFGLIHLSSFLVVGIVLIRSSRRAREVRDTIKDLISTTKQISPEGYVPKISSTGNDLAGLPDVLNLIGYEISRSIELLKLENVTLTQVMDSMADGVIVLNGDGQVTLFNDPAMEMFNIADLNPLGSRLAELIHDFEIIELASRAFDKGEQYQSEVELVENRMYLSVTATPLSPQMENGILITVHDLTGIKQTETSRKQFVSNVSHELRSPIASVKAMVEVLQDGAINENDVALDFLQRISRDLERMTTLVDDLLELSRIESGHESFNIETLELRPVVAEAISLVRDQNRAGISSDVTLINDTTNVDVMVEKGRLIQILVNLLQNALKFTSPVGEIKISNIQIGEFIEIHVSDTGSGISEDHVPYVFERFYKVDKSRSDQGTGLGLAIVKHLVQAHGGDVGLNSAEGEGSVFTFTLPMGR